MGSDIQGADFETIKSVGKDMKRIPWIATEVWHHNIQSYTNVNNDFCREWLPYMTSLGYIVRAVGFSDDESLYGGEYCLDILENANDLFTYCEKDKKLNPNPVKGYCECDILWAQNHIEWQNFQELPPISGRELFQFKWVGKGSLYKKRIHIGEDPFSYFSIKK